MQLINASVYEERAQARQNEILETKNKRLLERLGKRDKLERTKLYSFLKRKGRGNQVSVLGNLFRVTAQGNKLEKYQGPDYLVFWGEVLMVGNGVTPRQIKVGGVAFSRSKNGNYWRRGAVTASRTKSGKIIARKLTISRSTDKKDKLCQYFTKTGPFALKENADRRILRKRTILSIYPRPR